MAHKPDHPKEKKPKKPKKPKKKDIITRSVKGLWSLHGTKFKARNIVTGEVK